MTETTRIWAGPVVSFVVAVTFAVVLVIVLHWGVIEGARDIGMVMVGVLSSKYGTVIDYWIGSSSGSARKTEIAVETAAAIPLLPLGSQGT